MRAIGRRAALRSQVWPVVRRALSAAVAALLLLLALPLMVAIAVLVVLESPGPVFYRAERVGYRGRPLRMLKFRKMRVDAIGPALTTEDDPRLTRMGALLALTRLDELPQLWHVLRGEMSLVGPRPEDPLFVARYAHEYQDVLRVRPGITGWTQLVFANESRVLPVDDPLQHYVDVMLPQKLALDRLYAVRRSLRGDLRIAWFTFVVMILRRPVTVDLATGRIGLHRPASSADEMPPAGTRVATATTVTAAGRASSELERSA